MKNLFALLVLAFTLVLTSCTKEELIIEDSAAVQTAAITEIELPEIEDDVVLASVGQNSVEVTYVSYTLVGNQLIVDFTSNHSFFGVELEENQTLEFTDNNGGSSTLNFTVNDYTYSGGTLQVDFNLNGNNLGGLDMKSTQYIVIEDELVD